MVSKSLIVFLIATIALSTAQTPQQNTQTFLQGLFANLSLPTPTTIGNCLNNQGAVYFLNFINDLYFRSSYLQLGNLTGFNYYDAQFQQDLINLGPYLNCVFQSSDFYNLMNTIGLSTNIAGYYSNLTVFVDAFSSTIAYNFQTVITDFNLNYYYSGGFILGPFLQNMKNLLPLSTNNLAAFMIGVFTSQNISAGGALTCFSSPMLAYAESFYKSWFSTVSNTVLGSVYNASINYFNVNGFAYYNSATLFFQCLATSTSNQALYNSLGFGLDIYTSNNNFKNYFQSFVGSGPVDANIYKTQLQLANFYYSNNQPRLAGFALGEFLALL